MNWLNKKFSEEDMYKMFIYGDSIITAKKHVNTIKNKPLDDLFNDFVQSLQQTEWDCIIEMEELPYSSELSEEDIKNLEIFVPQNTTRPKLDAEGCLILKRI